MRSFLAIAAPTLALMNERYVLHVLFHIVDLDLAASVFHVYLTLLAFNNEQDELHNESRGGSYRRNRGGYFRESTRSYRDINDWGRSRRDRFYDRDYGRSTDYNRRFYGAGFGDYDLYGDNHWSRRGRRGYYGGGYYDPWYGYGGHGGYGGYYG